MGRVVGQHGCQDGLCQKTAEESSVGAKDSGDLGPRDQPKRFLRVFRSEQKAMRLPPLEIPHPHDGQWKNGHDRPQRLKHLVRRPGHARNHRQCQMILPIGKLSFCISGSMIREISWDIQMAELYLFFLSLTSNVRSKTGHLDPDQTGEVHQHLREGPYGSSRPHHRHRSRIQQ